MPASTTTVILDGLTYTLRVYEVDGRFFLDVSVVNGHMDLNAVYYGDTVFDGPSAGLSGPLNMNGAGSQYEGETVQWDAAVELSRPGLGPEGTDKGTYLEAGETYTLELDIQSLEEAALIGIRATSTSTPEQSIKEVSAPEEPDDDPVTYDKLFFITDTDAFTGVSIFAQDNGSTSPNDAFLPEGSRGTLQDYIDTFQQLAATREFWPDADEVQIINVYALDEDGNPTILVTQLDPAILSAPPLPLLALDPDESDQDLDADEDEPQPMIA